DREGRADPDLERDARLPDVQPSDPGRLRDQGAQGRGPPQGARVQARRLPPGDRQVMAVKNGYVPRLKERYEQELRSQLKEELGFKSVMRVPRVSKITLNMGVGEAKTETKALDGAIE